jgi:hypothetical protein
MARGMLGFGDAEEWSKDHFKRLSAHCGRRRQAFASQLDGGTSPVPPLRARLNPCMCSVGACLGW